MSAHAQPIAIIDDADALGRTDGLSARLKSLLALRTLIQRSALNARTIELETALGLWHDAICRLSPREKALLPALHISNQRPSAFIVRYSRLYDLSAPLSPSEMEIACQSALDMCGLRLALINRPELSLTQAQSLYPSLSIPLRRQVEQRFGAYFDTNSAFDDDEAHARLAHERGPKSLLSLLWDRRPHAYVQGICLHFALPFTSFKAWIGGPSYVPAVLSFRALGLDRAALKAALNALVGPTAIEPSTLRLLLPIFDLTDAMARQKLISCFEAHRRIESLIEPMPEKAQSEVC